MWIPCEIATYIVEYTCDETAYSTEGTWIIATYSQVPESQKQTV